MTWPPSTTHVAVVVLVAAATMCDLKTRRIPNSLTLGAAAVALVLQLALAGWPGLGFAASGWLLGLVLFFPVFALGGMGAGDVKLLAAIGAWLGPVGAAWTALYGALAGGIMALGVVLVQAIGARMFVEHIGHHRRHSRRRQQARLPADQEREQCHQEVAAAFAEIHCCRSRRKRMRE